MRFKLMLRQHCGILGQPIRSIAVMVFLMAHVTPAPPAVAAVHNLSRPVTMIAWPAPVGHRQPRAWEVPADNPTSQPRLDLLDRELTRKMTICRGC
jgi:hypothetical protein